MNPWALFLLIVGTGCFVGGAMSGTFNGASLVGLVLVILSLAVQSIAPRDRPPGIRRH